MATTETSARLLGRLGNGVSLSFIMLILVAMGASGVIALHEGTHRFLLPFTQANATAYVTRAVEAVRAQPTDTNIRQVSEEIWGLSRFAPVQHYADSRLMEQGIYYTTMPKTNQVSMVVHILFSVFCVLVGGLQFWPGFRKRFMTVHRGIGMVYIVTVPVSVVAALLYLTLTPPHHIYDHLVAWIALWVFGVLTLVSIAMAVKALKARRIFEHQAWMALSFGSLMVAPLLRLDWAFLAPIFPGIDQETLNLVTVGFMLPECLLIAYGLILVNRQYARPMKQRVPAVIAGHGASWFLSLSPCLYGLSLLLLGVNGWYYLSAHGLSGLAAAQAQLPAPLLGQDQAVLMAHPALLVLFVCSISLAFPALVQRLHELLAPSSAGTGRLAWLSRHVAPWLALLAGLTSCCLGWHIGLAPHNIWFSGGTMYLVNGLVLTGFSLFLLAAQRVQHEALMKESLVFLLCLLPFPTLFLLTLEVVNWIKLPADYLAAGQGFVIPVGFSAGLLFLAMFYVIYGQATREHN